MKPDKPTSGKTINEFINEIVLNECVKGIVYSILNDEDYNTSIKLYIEKAYERGYNARYIDIIYNEHYYNEHYNSGYQDAISHMLEELWVMQLKEINNSPIPQTIINDIARRIKRLGDQRE